MRLLPVCLSLLWVLSPPLLVADLDFLSVFGLVSLSQFPKVFTVSFIPSLFDVPVFPQHRFATPVFTVFLPRHQLEVVGVNTVPVLAQVVNLHTFGKLGHSTEGHKGQPVGGTGTPLLYTARSVAVPVPGPSPEPASTRGINPNVLPYVYLRCLVDKAGASPTAIDRSGLFGYKPLTASRALTGASPLLKQTLMVATRTTESSPGVLALKYFFAGRAELEKHYRPPVLPQLVRGEAGAGGHPTFGAVHEAAPIPPRTLSQAGSAGQHQLSAVNLPPQPGGGKE